jgi:hypothetical protein
LPVLGRDVAAPATLVVGAVAGLKLGPSSVLR